MAVCQCCEEREQVKNPDGPWCLECWRCGLRCTDCGRPLGIEDEGCTPETRLDWPTVCERCEGVAEAVDWIEKTCGEVERLAETHGWECGEWEWAQTRSRYVTLARTSGDPASEDYHIEQVRVRVSDHGSLYCREEISIALKSGGDDHDIEALHKLLAGV